MPGVTIHRCTVRVVRLGGWGTDRRRLLETIARVLPGLIGRHLASIWADDDRVAIAAPVRLSLSIGFSELLALAEKGPRAGSVPAAQLAEVETRINIEVRRAIAHARSSTETSTPKPARLGSISVTDDGGKSGRVNAIIALLLKWYTDGSLPERVAALSREQLQEWHDSLFAGIRPEGQEAEGRTLGDVERIAALFQSESPNQIADRVALIRHRTIIAIATAAAWKLDRVHPLVNAYLNRVMPVDGSVANRRALQAVDDNHQPSDAVIPDASAKSARVPQERLDDAYSVATASSFAQTPVPPVLRAQRSLQPSAGVQHISSALPFLIFGSLARIGYLDAIDAVFTGSKLEPTLPLFGAALAYKVLAPLERGWLRTSAAGHAASVAAILDDQVSDMALGEMARRVAARLAPADDELAVALTKDRQIARPVVLIQAGVGPQTGYLLIDTDGQFPIAWSRSLDTFRLASEPCKLSVLLIARATASPEVLSAADLSGWRFVTDAPPARVECWRRLRGSRGIKRWTNDTHESASKLLRQADRLEAASGLGAAAWTALAIERAAVPRASDPTFEISATLAAGVALADLAWRLWPANPECGPLLALERFGDLDARVHIDESRVLVRLPLGRRHQDLGSAGLLDSVGGIPWFGNRVLEFSGG